MQVALCSSFRNANHYLDRYFTQVAGLRKRLARRGDSLTLCLGEGDSIDGTRGKLNSLLSAFDNRLVYVDHGGLDYGSVVHPQRFRQLAGVWSAIWALIPASADVVVFCESDLIWKPDTLLWLIDDCRPNTAIAPMVMLERYGYPRPMFYDVWAAKKDGKPFEQRPPYFPGWGEVAEDTVQIDSAGSCLVIDGALARSLVWDERLIVGMCEQIRAQEGQVLLNCAAEVIHP